LHFLLRTLSAADKVRRRKCKGNSNCMWQYPSLFRLQDSCRTGSGIKQKLLRVV